MLLPHPGLKAVVILQRAYFRIFRLKKGHVRQKNEQYGLTKLSWYKSAQSIIYSFSRCDTDLNLMLAKRAWV
jgi:hypothetical protein